MAATAAEIAAFRLWAPELDSEADTRVSAMLDAVRASIEPAAFGDPHDEALARLAAHELSLAARAQRSLVGNTPVGTPTSLTLPKASVSWAGPSSSSNGADDDYLRQTQHGLAFLRIRESLACAGAMLLT